MNGIEYMGCTRNIYGCNITIENLILKVINDLLLHSCSPLIVDAKGEY